MAGGLQTQERATVEWNYNKCELVGMNADYIRDLRIRSIRRRIQKIPTNGQMMKFSETLGNRPFSWPIYQSIWKSINLRVTEVKHKLSFSLDPFQENFLAILEGFWIIYRNKQANAHEVDYFYEIS